MKKRRAGRSTINSGHSGHSGSGGTEKSAYEREREALLEENRRILSELNIPVLRQETAQNNFRKYTDKELGLVRKAGRKDKKKKPVPVRKSARLAAMAEGVPANFKHDNGAFPSETIEKQSKEEEAPRPRPRASTEYYRRYPTRLLRAQAAEVDIHTHITKNMRKELAGLGMQLEDKTVTELVEMYKQHSGSKHMSFYAAVGGPAFFVRIQYPRPHCDCRDHKMRQVNCKHILATLLYFFHVPETEAYVKEEARSQIDMPLFTRLWDQWMHMDTSVVVHRDATEDL